MSLQVEKLEKNMAKLTIETEPEELEKAIQSAYLKNRRKFSLPGFRKGKAPRVMIEKMYGVEIFYEDAANIILPEAYAKALDESELEVVARPEIDITQVEKGKPFIFTATVALKPEVTLGQYQGIEIEKIETEVTEEDINAEIVKVQEQNSRLITVEDRAVAAGDQVIIDFQGFVDDVPFEGGTGEDYELTIGSHSFIDTFEEQLIGKEIDEETEVSVTFPEDYHVADLAAKPALFQVKIKDIKVKELPEADDEFAGEVSEFDTLAEYKEDLKAKLLENKEKEAKTQRENKAIGKIIEGAQMDIPEPMIKNQIGSMLEDFERRMQTQGLTIEQYMQFTGMTADKMEEQMRPSALNRIQTRLVLEAVAKAEDIQVSDEEIDKEMEAMAAAYKMEADKMKTYMGEKEIQNMKMDMAVQKAIDLVVNEAKEI